MLVRGWSIGQWERDRRSWPGLRSRPRDEGGHEEPEQILLPLVPRFRHHVPPGNLRPKRESRSALRGNPKSQEKRGINLALLQIRLLRRSNLAFSCRAIRNLHGQPAGSRVAVGRVPRRAHRRVILFFRPIRASSSNQISLRLPGASRAAICATVAAKFYGMARPSSSSVTLAGQPKERRSSMQIAILGIDLGKNSCSVVGLDNSGQVVVRRRMHRTSVIKFAGGLVPCVAAMEACCGAHHLGRLLRTQGHEVRLMSPEYVGPYVKAQKNDERDAEAIAEAATRPTMRFVELKAEEQLDMQTLHRVRDRLVGARSALYCLLVVKRDGLTVDRRFGILI